MQAPDIILGIVATLTFLLAGFVKGVIGLGLPTVAIGLLGLVMTPAQAAALLVVPSLATNVWQLALGPAIGSLVRRLWPMLLCFCIGTWGGALAFPVGMTDFASGLLGLALIIYAAIGLGAVRFHVSPKSEQWASPVVGVATGVVAVSTGVFVIPAVPYLQALGLQKDELVQALGLSFTVSTLALASVLLANGTMKSGLALSSMLALLPAAGGMLLGQRIRARVSPGTFRICFFIGLLLLGAHLAVRDLFAA